MIYEFFSCSTNIPRGLSAYKPYKLVVCCFNNLYLSKRFNPEKLNWESLIFQWFVFLSTRQNAWHILYRPTSKISVSGDNTLVRSFRSISPSCKIRKNKHEHYADTVKFIFKNKDILAKYIIKGVETKIPLYFFVLNELSRVDKTELFPLIAESVRGCHWIALFKCFPLHRFS